MKIKILILTLAFAILLVSIFIYLGIDKEFFSKKQYLHLQNKDVFLIIANNSNERMRGLSARESISDNEAMLFVFNELGDYGIWMKDMNFSIDIFWLNEHKKIIDIQHNVSPTTYPNIFHSKSESLYILEAKAGFAKNNNLEVGNFLNFDLK